VSKRDERSLPSYRRKAPLVEFFSPSSYLNLTTSSKFSIPRASRSSSAIFMWPFFLVSFATLPFTAYASKVEMDNLFGYDESNKEGTAETKVADSAGTILTSSLNNIKTVYSLNLQSYFERAYYASNRVVGGRKKKALRSGLVTGLSMLIQMLANALQFWFGSWILMNYSDKYTFRDFLISMFALLFSLFGLGAGLQGVADKDKAKLSIMRLLRLFARESKIDPILDETGQVKSIYASALGQIAGKVVVSKEIESDIVKQV